MVDKRLLKLLNIVFYGFNFLFFEMYILLAVVRGSVTQSPTRNYCGGPAFLS